MKRMTARKEIEKWVGNEYGAVLLTVLMLLVLLSILGLAALSTSTTEIDITGNTRRSQIAFYNADAGIEYAMTASTIYTGSTWPYTETRTIDDGNSSTTDYTSAVQVNYLTRAALPAGSGYAAEVGESGSTLGDYYRATATGTGPSSTQEVVEAQYARLVQGGS